MEKIISQKRSLDQMIQPFIYDLISEFDALGSDQGRDPKRLEELLVIGFRVYGGTGSDELVPFISQAYRLAVSKLQWNNRRDVWRYLDQGISRGELRYDALVPLVMWEPEDRLASTASLDLVAFSSLDQNEVPAGVRTIYEHLEHGVINPGAVVGGLIVLGDRNLTPAVTPLRKHFDSKAAMAAAARCRSAILLNASVDFWLTWAEELVHRSDLIGQEAFSLCASALVNLRTAASSDIVVDAFRRYPSRGSGSVQPIRQWTMSSYADHIAPRLFELEAEECTPKIMDQVLIAWGLKPRSMSSDRVFDRQGQKHN